MWDLIVSVPDNRLSFYFEHILCLKFLTSLCFAFAKTPYFHHPHMKNSAVSLFLQAISYDKMFFLHSE